MTKSSLQFSIPAFGAFWLAALLLGGAHAAEERKADTLKVSFDARGMRSNAPARVRATFTWTSTRILEGRLDLVFHHGNQPLGSYRSFDLALSGGEQAFDLLLPSLGVDGTPTQVDVDVRFVTSGRTLELEPAIWAVPHALQRACVLGASTPPLEADAYSKLTASLRLDALQPERKGAGVTQFSYIPLFATPALIPPDEFPADPLAYCSFDVAFLPGKGFSLLRENQLIAMAKWVRAGGSVCVMPMGALDARHLRFLNDLAGTPSPTFTVDSLGVLRPAAPPAGKDPVSVLTFRSGVGRLAVVLKPPAEADLASPAWRRTVAFLWKLRHEQLKTVADTGKWDIGIQFSDSLPPFSRDPNFRGDRSQGTPAHPVSICEIREVIQGLMPHQVRIIPFSVVVLILGLFVLAIGPLDYFLLGLIRRRKYTWITFPLIAIAFTYFTVKLSDYYMGLRDLRRALVFVDVDRQGRALRQHRFEMVFAGSEHTARYDVKNALFQPIGRADAREWDPDPMGRYNRPQVVRRTYGQEPGLDALDQPQTFAYEGRFPSHFTAVQPLYQWTPQLNRTFSLEASDPLPKLNWDAIAFRDILSPPAPGWVRQKLLGNSGLPVSVCVFRGSSWNFSSDADSASRPQVLFNSRATLLVNTTVHPERGFFSLVSQVSPTGAPNFEDLAILDPTDENEAAVVVVHEVGEDIYVYRCLYR